MSIAFIDLQAQRRRLGARLERAIAAVLEHGQYIMGPEVAALEGELAAFGGVAHAVSCANGTDALALALMALELRPGEAVLVPSFTFAATAEVVPWLGAAPVFVDVRAEDFNLDPDRIEPAVAAARRAGLRPVGIIAVDLFGQPADYGRILPMAAALGLWVVADAAQSFGATLDGRPVGQLARLTTTSFFPAKPLGCYGDGGAVLTDDPELAAVLRSLRVHGQGRDKYDNVRIGMNARLDTLQAAILREKLQIFPDEIVARGRIAERYAAGLADLVTVPRLRPGASSVWAQYTIRVADRATLAARLAAAGIPTQVYYRLPLHRQTAYRRYALPGADCPVADRLALEVLSLPMHPYLTPAEQERICGAIAEALR
jgi:dTDP-4-amino-4,6-dideoxygalactose transaminase